MIKIDILVDSEPHRPPKKFYDFYQLELKGRISKYSTQVGSITLKLYNHSGELAFDQLAGNKPDVHKVIAVGDSLIKEEQANFFYLKKKDGTVYTITFYVYDMK